MMGEDIYCMVAPGFIEKGRFIWLPYTHHQVAHLAVRRVHGLKITTFLIVREIFFRNH